MVKHTKTVLLETDRLILKLDSISEEELLWKYMYSDKEAVRVCKWKDFGDLDTFKKLHSKSISNINDSDYWWTIWIKKLNIPIGGITVHHQDDLNGTCEIGYSINPKYQNNGYASEALVKVIDFLKNEVGYKYVICNCKLSNSASKRVMEKASMEYYGIIRDDNLEEVYSYRK